MRLKRLAGLGVDNMRSDQELMRNLLYKRGEVAAELRMYLGPYTKDTSSHLST